MPLFKQKPKNQPRQVKSEPVRRSTNNTYYRGDPRPADSPFAKKAPKKPIRRYMFGALDIILLVALVAALLYSLGLNANANILASSRDYHDSSVYRAAVTQQLAQLRNRNKITFDQTGLTKKLETRFPEIAAVQVELPILSERPTVRLAIAPPSFFLISADHSYVVSAAGKAVAMSGDLPRVQSLLTIQDQSGYRVIPGQQILSTGSVTFINNVIVQCRRAGVPISALTLPPTPQELDLRAKDQSYYVKFYLGGDALTESGQFLAARAKFKQIDQQPTQYLDVRITGKVFYK